MSIYVVQRAKVPLVIRIFAKEPLTTAVQRTTNGGRDHRLVICQITSQIGHDSSDSTTLLWWSCGSIYPYPSHGATVT